MAISVYQVNRVECRGKASAIRRMVDLGVDYFDAKRIVDKAMPETTFVTKNRRGEFVELDCLLDAAD